MGSVLISLNYTVDDCLLCIKEKNAELLSCIIYCRFFERFIQPICDCDVKHGFSIMAISCLMIESFQSFKEGRDTTYKKSKKMFNHFFRDAEQFSEFIPVCDDFYYNVRCGILHQAETKNGWKIWRVGKLLDNKIINAEKFVNALHYELRSYVSKIKKSDFCSEITKNAVKKLEYICKNCE